MPKPGCSRLSSRWWTPPTSDTPTHLSFLWGDRKRSLQSTPAVSHWQTGEETLSYPPLPSPPFSLRYVLTSLTPTFSSQSPLSGWLVFSASSTTKETKEAGPLSLSPPTRERRRSGGKRLTGHPFKSCKDHASTCKCVHVKFLHQIISKTYKLHSRIF